MNNKTSNDTNKEKNHRCVLMGIVHNCRVISDGQISKLCEIFKFSRISL
jgi:hypothetical protein